MRIAIIGSGVSGLVAAHLLAPDHDVTVYEADDRPGGHANTVRVELGDESHDVDTGFIVYNERNYPGLCKLFDQLGVETQPSDMSFSVSHAESGIEYKSTLGQLFADRRNIVRPGFWKLLIDILRFNGVMRGTLGDDGRDAALADVLDDHGFSDFFRQHYALPLGAAIWSADPTTFDRFPARSLAHFLDNHGLISLGDRPAWRTVTGGSIRYVRRIADDLGDRLRLASPVRRVCRSVDGDDPVTVDTDRFGQEGFDAVVLACHSDQALRLLGDASDAEHEILGSIDYRPNRATLHTDASLLPAQRRAWASWNYRVPAATTTAPTLTYHQNRLQSLTSRHEICVSLNSDDAIDPALVIDTFDYSHPVFDGAAMAAQRRRAEIQGVANTWFCGAWWGYGFHEDGVQSALDVTRGLGVTW